MIELKQPLSTFSSIATEAPPRENAGELADSQQPRQRLMSETFIGILAHDLRAPLAAVSSGLRILNRIPAGPQPIDLVALMQRSVVRMEEMIGTMLDFTRIRLGIQLQVDLRRGFEVETILRQVADEFRLAWPGREICCDVVLKNDVICDASRIAQIASNLLRNAIVYGDGGPVQLSAHSDEHGFEFSVTNTGIPIDEHRIAGLFDTFAYENEPAEARGLGLGLFIASRIAASHHGSMSVTSSATGTRFTFRMSR